MSTLSEHKRRTDAGPVNFNDVFSLRNPKDIRAGVSSGLKSVAKGVIGGALSIVAAPALGAAEQGWAGFAKGVATGEFQLMHTPLWSVSMPLMSSCWSQVLQVLLSSQWLV
jgi:hypothetical protein